MTAVATAPKDMRFDSVLGTGRGTGAGRGPDSSDEAALAAMTAGDNLAGKRITVTACKMTKTANAITVVSVDGQPWGHITHDYRGEAFAIYRATDSAIDAADPINDTITAFAAARQLPVGNTNLRSTETYLRHPDKTKES